MPLFKFKNSSKASKSGLVPSGSSSNISDYLPPNACRRNSWTDVSLGEFLDFKVWRSAKLADDKVWEYKLARLEEINEARAELGLDEWVFHPLMMNKALVHWYGAKIVHVQRPPFDDGFEDECEPSSTSNGGACRRGGRTETSPKRGLTDKIKGLVSRGA